MMTHKIIYCFTQSINILKRLLIAIIAEKSKALPDESIKSFNAYSNNISLVLNCIYTKLRAKLDGHCLKQEK